MSSLESLHRWRLERKVRKEATSLVREVRRVIRRFPKKLGLELRQTLEGEAAKLEEAWQKNDPDTLKHQLAELDALSDRHLGFARKSSSRELVESVGFAILVALVLRAFALEAFKIPSASMIPTLEIGDRIFVDKISYGLRIPGTTQRLFEARKPQRGEVIVFMNPCTPERDFIKRVVALEDDTVEVRCDVVFVNGEAVPSERVDQQDECWFWNKEEGLSMNPWRAVKCSHYRETVGGESYSTFHTPARPLREEQRQDSAAYTDASGANDFPGHRLPYCRNNLKVEPKGRIVQEEKSDETGPCRQRRHYVVPKGHVFAMGDNRPHSSDSREWGPVPVENIKGRALFIWWSSQRQLLPSAQDRPDAPIADWQRIGKTVD